MHPNRPPARADRRIQLPRWMLASTVLLVLVALLTGCGDDDDGAAPPGEPSQPAIVIDWTDRTTPDDTGEYTVSFCEGDGPFLCFEHDGEFLGTIELVDYDVASLDVIRDALAGGASPVEALEAHAADFAANFAADRAEGCGPDYVVTADEVVPMTVGGQPGLRFGWTAQRDGAVVERVVTYGVITDGTLFSLVAIGLTDDGCLERMGELPIGELEGLLPTLDRVAAGSKLPAPTASAP